MNVLQVSAGLGAAGPPSILCFSSPSLSYSDPDLMLSLSLQYKKTGSQCHNKPPKSLKSVQKKVLTL